MNKAVFFDRDGTLNSDEGRYYIWRVEDIVFNPGVFQGLKKLQDAGFLLFIITNQGGIAKGIYTENDVEKVHAYMCSELHKQGIRIEKIYYCPHHESVSPCNCRKPSPYMINQAITTYNIDKKHAYMIGDSDRDIQAAEAAGIKGIKIAKNSDISPAIETILAKKL